MVTCTAPVALCVSVNEAGATERVYAGNAVTARAIGAVASVTPVALLRAVSVYVPGAVLTSTLMVIVAVVNALVVTTFDTAAVTPVGAPSTEMATSPVNPPPRVTVAVTGALPPCTTVALAPPSTSAIVGVGVGVVGVVGPAELFPPPEEEQAVAEAAQNTRAQPNTYWPRMRIMRRSTES
jgi:hypothetical protein